MLASLKLIDLVEKNAEVIARQWVGALQTNKRTPHYHGLPAERLQPQAAEFYRQLKKLLMSANTFEETQDYFHRYARTCFEEGIPLHEAIYALVLMRRQMWLFAEFQTAFVTAVEHQQAIDSITRTILMMDYAVHKITQYYLELMKKDLK
ncbi:MAG TPA: hypothetical protein PK114_02165 [Smithellaceae bacterium]|nr:hypothetical protein [Smithellaceae bacterium]